jgi:pimeloyl-ACP methyl ester carboxylesterase
MPLGPQPGSRLREDAAMESATLTVHTEDGRDLEVVVDGPAEGPVLVFHSGTPSGAVSFPILSGPAAARGTRTVSWSRPGYGSSTPQPGRTVASVAADTDAVLRALDVTDFVTLGWSGGGPHALACAALLPDRCRAAALVGGVAPRDATGFDWLAGMGAENLEEFAAAAAGATALEAFLEPVGRSLRSVTAEGIVAGMGDLVDEVDRTATKGEIADWLAASMRRAVAAGTEGWRDDDLAFVDDWGIELSSISCPVSVWQGEHDRMVPDSHARWLAEQIAGATLRLDPAEGHISLMLRSEEILADLLAAAGT